MGGLGRGEGGEGRVAYACAYELLHEFAFAFVHAL